MRIILPILILLFITGASAQEVLKSSSVRAKICANILESLDLEGLETSYEDRWEEQKIVLFPEFEKTCETLTNSFVVTDVTYNDRAKKVAKLSVVVDITVEKELGVKASYEFKRSLFDSETGEVKVGSWEIVQDKVKFSYANEIFVKIASVISHLAAVDGGGTERIFDVSAFSLEKELAALNAEIRESNADSGCVMTEAESFGLEGRRSIFDYLYVDADTDVDYLFDFLKRQDQVLAVIFSTSEEWEESCAYHNVYIYLKSGVKISLNYDQTT